MISPTYLEGTNVVSKNVPSQGNDNFDALVLRYLDLPPVLDTTIS